MVELYEVSSIEYADELTLCTVILPSSGPSPEDDDDEEDDDEDKARSDDSDASMEDGQDDINMAIKEDTGEQVRVFPFFPVLFCFSLGGVGGGGRVGTGIGREY